MALADNPVEHILHMFGMEMRTNPTHACQVFPHGAAPAGLPLQSGELAYGCLLSNYFFTPLGFIWKDNGAWHRLNWADIVGCSATHGSGTRPATIKLVGGAKVTLPLSQFGPGWGGRIGQLFFAMIERWRVPQRDRDFVLEPEKFFKLAKQDDAIAPNLFPDHPGLAGMRARLHQLKSIEGIEQVFLVVTDYEDGVPCVQEVLLVCTEPPTEDELAFMEFSFVGTSQRRTAKLFGPETQNRLLISGIWD